MAHNGCREADGLGELECDGAFAYGNGDGSQKNGNQRDVSDRNGTQITPVEKENRTAPRANRVEFALPSNLEKAESAEARETPEQDQRECRVGGSSQEHTEQEFQFEFDCKTRNSRNGSHASSKACIPSWERTHWIELWKNLRMDCGSGTLISTEKLERVLSKLKNGKGSPDQITADVFKALLPDFLRKLARSVSVMCWEI